MASLHDDDPRSGPFDGGHNYDIDLIFKDMQIQGATSCRDWVERLFDSNWELRVGTLWNFPLNLLTGNEIEANVLSRCLSQLIMQDPKYDVRVMALEREAEAVNSTEIALSNSNRRYFLGDFLRAACQAPMPEMTRVRQTAIGTLSNNVKWLLEPAAYNYPHGQGFVVNTLAEGLIMGLENENGSFPNDILKGCVVELLNQVVKRQSHDSPLVQDIRRLYGRLTSVGSSLRIENPELRAMIFSGFNPLGLTQGS